jgi:hypothetical protein
MRGAALAIAIALLLAGCAAGAPASGVNEKQGYNRRELQPDTPGLLTGPRGVWTIYSSGPAPKSQPEARQEECSASGGAAQDASDTSCPAPAKPHRTVLLPAP